MALSGRVVGLAGVAAVILLIVPRPEVAILLDLGIALGVLVDLLLAVPVHALEVGRDGPTATRLGEPVTVHLLVTNRHRRRLRAVVRDAWPPSAGAPLSGVPLSVPAGRRESVGTALLPTRRGDRYPAYVVIRSFGPLGLAARQGRLSAPWRLRVLPAFPSRRRLPAALARLRQLDGGVPSTPLAGPGTEFDTLRDYVEGDDPRAVDWRASARRGTVVVRTWRPERGRRVVLALDTGRTSAARVGDAPRLDAALDAALLLTAVADRAGDRVDLIGYDRRLRTEVLGVGRGEVLAAVATATAGLEPDLVETDVPGLVAHLLRRAHRRCLVVLFTALDPAPVEEGLLPVLPALTARHLVIVAAVLDPVERALAGGRGDAEAVYGAAAAAQVASRRERVVGQLRRRGVRVVAAEPDELAAALTDAYLDLRAAGRL